MTSIQHDTVLKKDLKKLVMWFLIVDCNYFNNGLVEIDYIDANESNKHRLEDVII
jgi:hypothetical protein